MSEDRGRYSASSSAYTLFTSIFNTLIRTTKQFVMQKMAGIPIWSNTLRHLDLKGAADPKTFRHLHNITLLHLQTIAMWCPWSVELKDSFREGLTFIDGMTDLQPANVPSLRQVTFNWWKFELPVKHLNTRLHELVKTFRTPERTNAGVEDLLVRCVANNGCNNSRVQFWQRCQKEWEEEQRIK
jgi:hypothetical protein